MSSASHCSVHAYPKGDYSKGDLDSDPAKEKSKALAEDHESSSSDHDETFTSGPLHDKHHCLLSKYYVKMVKSLEEKEKSLNEWRQKYAEMEKEATNLGLHLLQLHNPFVVNEAWLSGELEKAQGLLSDSVMSLPACDDFPSKWKSVNKLLRKSGCPHDKSGLPIEVLMTVESEALTFAVSSIVWKTLCTPYFLGASSEQREMLQDLEKNLGNLKPGIPTGRIEEWRSDTLRAFALSDGHEKQVKIECQKAKDLIAEMLNILDYDDGKRPKRFLWEVDRNLIQPMADIATQIKLSPRDYTWDWLCPRPVLYKCHTEHLEILDLATHFTTHADFSHLSNNDVIGDCIIPIFPVLFRHGTNDEENELVSKGHVAVKVHDKAPDYRRQLIVESANSSVKTSKYPWERSSEQNSYSRSGRAPNFLEYRPPRAVDQCRDWKPMFPDMPYRVGDEVLTPRFRARHADELANSWPGGDRRDISWGHSVRTHDRANGADSPGNFSRMASQTMPASRARSPYQAWGSGNPKSGWDTTSCTTAYRSKRADARDLSWSAPNAPAAGSGQSMYSQWGGSVAKSRAASMLDGW